MPNRQLVHGFLVAPPCGQDQVAARQLAYDQVSARGGLIVIPNIGRQMLFRERQPKVAVIGQLNLSLAL
jgi:hypothetical protein